MCSFLAAVESLRLAVWIGCYLRHFLGDLATDLFRKHLYKPFWTLMCLFIFYLLTEIGFLADVLMLFEDFGGQARRDVFLGLLFTRTGCDLLADIVEGSGFLLWNMLDLIIKR